MTLPAVGAPSIFADCETRSALDLKRVGVWRYVEDPTTDVLMVSYAVNGGQVNVWKRGDPVPYDVAVLLAEDGLVYFHNAAFDTVVWNAILQPRYGWPELPLERVRCTASMAVAMGLPRSLEQVAEVLRLPVQKDRDGQKLMLQMARPARYDDQLQPTWDETPEQMTRLASYAGTDVAVMRPMRRYLFDLRPREQELYALTQRINQRGVRVDLEAVHAAIPMVKFSQAGLARRIAEVTGGEITSPTQVARIQSWLQDRLVGVPSLRRRIVEIWRAQAGQLPDDVDAVLDIRLEAAKASVAKLMAMINRTSIDGRLRGALVYHGASTGRFTATGVQLQNLPRPSMSHALCCMAIETIRSGDQDALELLYGPTLQTVSDCLRSFFIPDPGKRFVVCDFSKIEAIVNAWVAGHTTLLQAFRDSRDVYAEMASSVYGRPIDRKRDKIEGQVGKVLVLAAGYMMGPDKFWQTCILADVPISREMAIEAIATYRRVNDAIVQNWYAQERAAMDAVRRPGTMIDCSCVTWTVRNNILWCFLPSGRPLAYPMPHIRDMPDRHGVPRPRLLYRGIEPVTRKWVTLATYGGELVENITQAIARDLMTEAMLVLDGENVETVLSVHDELVTETRERQADAELRLVKHVMETSPAWGRGLPVTAEGWVLDRYGKP